MWLQMKQVHSKKKKKMKKWIYHQMKSWRRDCCALWYTPIRGKTDPGLISAIDPMQGDLALLEVGLICWYLKQAVSVYCHRARMSHGGALPSPVLHICGAHPSAGCLSAGWTLKDAALGASSVTFFFFFFLEVAIVSRSIARFESWSRTWSLMPWATH